MPKWSPLAGVPRAWPLMMRLAMVEMRAVSIGAPMVTLASSTVPMKPSRPAVVPARMVLAIQAWPTLIVPMPVSALLFRPRMKLEDSVLPPMVSLPMALSGPFPARGDLAKISTSVSCKSPPMVMAAMRLTAWMRPSSRKLPPILMVPIPAALWMVLLVTEPPTVRLARLPESC